MTVNPQRLMRRIIQEGIMLNYWDDYKDAASAIEIHVSTLTQQMNGEIKTIEVLDGTNAKLKAALDERKKKTPPKKVETEISEMRKLYLRGIELERWDYSTECATQLEVNDAVLRRYLRQTTTLKSVKAKGFATKLVSKFRKNVGPLPSEPNATQEPTTTLKEHVPKQTPIAHAHGPPAIIVGEAFNQLLAGITEFPDQVLDGIHFVISAGRLRKLRGAITDADIKDTVLLIAELRRRIGIFAQLDDNALRGKIVKAIDQEISELFLVVEQNKRVVPTDAAEYIERLRVKPKK